MKTPSLPLSHLTTPLAWRHAVERGRLVLYASLWLLWPAALWLLDEPVSALDSDSVARLRSAIARHRAGGGMVALSSHGGIEIPDAVTLDLTDFAAAAA